MTQHCAAWHPTDWCTTGITSWQPNRWTPPVWLCDRHHQQATS